MKIIFKMSVVFLCFALSSCQQTLSYDYLMQHPDVLEKEYEYCRNQTRTQCDEVVRAAEDFRSLIQKHNEDPESTGLQIMQAQQKGDAKTVRVLYAVVRVSQDI
jgi:hypothetical protein